MELRKSPITYLFLGIAVFVFFYFTVEVNNKAVLPFDQKISYFFTNVFTEKLNPFFKLLNVIGSPLGIGITSLLVVAIVWLKRNDYLGISVIALTVATGSIINKAVKNVIERPRPELEHLVHVKSYSFPSGHAMMSMILYLLIAYFIAMIVHRRFGKWLTLIIFLLIILLMGISRIVLHVHYPSDVVAGFSLGFIWVFFGIVIYEFLCKKL